MGFSCKSALILLLSFPAYSATIYWDEEAIYCSTDSIPGVSYQKLPASGSLENASLGYNVRCIASIVPLVITVATLTTDDSPPPPPPASDCAVGEVQVCVADNGGPVRVLSYYNDFDTPDEAIVQNGWVDLAGAPINLFESYYLDGSSTFDRPQALN